MNIKRYDCSPGVDGYMSEDADGEYVRHEDIAAVLKDAERYRWLREKCAWTLTSGPDGTRISVHMPGVDVTAIGPGEDEFDAAIDAAMRK